MKEACPILTQELEKKIEKRDRLLKEISKVVHLEKLDCINALLDYIEKVHWEIRLLKLAID